MPKLSIPCCNKYISKRARRKVFLQIQVDIVRIVEDQEPISVGLVRKPPQTCIYCSLCISCCNGFEIRLKGLFARGVNIEDFGEALKNYVVSKPRFDFI